MKKLKVLKTSKDVVSALGGLEIVARMTGTDYKTTWHWMSRADFPARFHDMMTAALRRRGYTAPPQLWNQAVERVGVEAAVEAELRAARDRVLDLTNQLRISRPPPKWKKTRDAKKRPRSGTKPKRGR